MATIPDVMYPEIANDNENDDNIDNTDQGTTAATVAQCPFCCKGFTTDKHLLEHVKTNNCRAKIAKKKDVTGLVTALIARVDKLENVVVTLENRVDALARNEVILLDRIRLMKDLASNNNGLEKDDVEPAPAHVPPHGSASMPYDRCSISHIEASEIAKCVKEYEYSGIRRMARLIYFNQEAPHNKAIISNKGRSMTVYICTEEGQWDLHSKASALKRICRQVLCYMSAKLDDEDLQVELMRLYGIHKAKLDKVIGDIDECINDATGKTHRKFYDDVWCLLTSS